jgi:carbon-monoxide dehydrogenase large subunit
MSAVIDALRDFGVRDIKMPATPYNVWRAIQNAKAAGADKANADNKVTK